MIITIAGVRYEYDTRQCSCDESGLVGCRYTCQGSFCGRFDGFIKGVARAAGEFGGKDSVGARASLRDVGGRGVDGDFGVGFRSLAAGTCEQCRCRVEHGLHVVGDERSVVGAEAVLRVRQCLLDGPVADGGEFRNGGGRGTVGCETGGGSGPGEKSDARETHGEFGGLGGNGEALLGLGRGSDNATSGDGGGLSTGGGDAVGAAAVSARTLANRQKRVKAKERRARARVSAGAGSADVPVVPEWRRGAVGVAATVVPHARYVAGVVNAGDDGDLAASVRRKWMAKNELEAVKAEREAAVLRANDVDAEAKRYRTKVLASTEANMVRIEKVHGQLRASGNVTDDDESRVKTVLSGSSATHESISPDSSASQAEVRQMQKDLIDAKAREDALAGYLKGMGVDIDLVPYYQKANWTVDSNGEFGDKYEEVLNRLYPGGFVDGNDSIHGDDGKVRHQVIGMAADGYYD